MIALTKTINTIYLYFGREPDVVQGGDVDRADPDVVAVVKAKSEAENVNNNTEKIDTVTAPEDEEAEDNLLSVNRSNSKRKKSSVIQTLSNMRKRSTKKKSISPPADSHEATPEPEHRGRKKSVATLFIHLARKPSMGKRKKSATPTSEPKEAEKTAPASPENVSIAKQRWSKVRNVSLVLGAMKKKSSNA